MQLDVAIIDYIKTKLNQDKILYIIDKDRIIIQSKVWKKRIFVITFKFNFNELLLTSYSLHESIYNNSILINLNDPYSIKKINNHLNILISLIKINQRCELFNNSIIIITITFICLIILRLM